MHGAGTGETWMKSEAAASSRLSLEIMKTGVMSTYEMQKQYAMRMEKEGSERVGRI